VWIGVIFFLLCLFFFPYTLSGRAKENVAGAKYNHETGKTDKLLYDEAGVILEGGLAADTTAGALMEEGIDVEKEKETKYIGEDEKRKRV
jgi:hypothetical protein